MGLLRKTVFIVLLVLLAISTLTLGVKIQPVGAGGTSTLIVCSPSSVSVYSPVNCTATVFGSSPTGNVTWSSSSSTGSFSPPFCTLSSGTCSTTYADNFTGYVTITANYYGDSNNDPSIGRTILTVFLTVTVGANVTVYPARGLGLTFANVNTSGVVIANETATVQAPPLNNTVGQYYDVRVTAGYSGNVRVSLVFDGSNMTQEQKNNLRMMQYTPIPGDIRPAFGKVDMADIGYIARRFGISPESPLWDPAADINGDGKINMMDIGLAARNFGRTASWADITSYVDTANNIIYGSTTHFSLIGIH